MSVSRETSCAWQLALIELNKLNTTQKVAKVALIPGASSQHLHRHVRALMARGCPQDGSAVDRLGQCCSPNRTPFCVPRQAVVISPTGMFHHSREVVMPRRVRLRAVSTGQGESEVEIDHPHTPPYLTEVAAPTMPD